MCVEIEIESLVKNIFKDKLLWGSFRFKVILEVVWIKEGVKYTRPFEWEGDIATQYQIKCFSSIGEYMINFKERFVQQREYWIEKSSLYIFYL